MEVTYRPGLLRTVRSECSENAPSLDSVINDVLLEVLEDKPIWSVFKTLRGFQSSLQRLGATLAREVQLLESMEAKAAEFRIDFKSDASNPDDSSPPIANVPQTTSQPRPSMFRGLSARYPTIGEDYEVAITYSPSLLRRIRRRCHDAAASQALTISEVLQDQFAMEPTPMKVEILSNFEETLRSVSATLVREVTILDSMERKAAELRKVFEAKVGTTREAEEEVLGKGEGDTQENECLPEPISPDHYSSKSPPFMNENDALQPPMTPQEVRKLLEILPLRAATLKGFDFNFTKGFMNGVLQLCALILELDTKQFANEDAKRIVDTCFKAAGQPYELVFIADGPGLLKMNFAKRPYQRPAPASAAPVATPSAPVTPDTFEGPISTFGKTSDHRKVEEIIDSIEQVSPNGDTAANGSTAREDGDDDIMTDIPDTGEMDAQSARALITAEHGSSTVLALEYVSDARDTNASVEPILVDDNVHGLPTSLVRPSLDKRETDVLRRFAAEYDRLESPNESYLVAGTFDERRRRRELAEEAFGILLSKYYLVSTLSKEAENYLLFKFTDQKFNRCLAADVLPQKLPRNGNPDEKIHSPVSIAETSTKHGDREPKDSSTARAPTSVVPCKKEAVDPSNYDATPPPQEASLSKVSNAQIRTHNSLNLGQSSQRRQRSLFALATETSAPSSPFSAPESPFDNGEKSDGQVVDGGIVHVDEERGANPIEENVTRDELFAAIKRNWSVSVDDFCTRPFWRRVPGRGLLKLLVRLSEVCPLNDANNQLRAEIRTRRNRDRNFRYVNESVLRSLVAANEPLRTQRRNEDGGPSFGADSPRPLPQIDSTEDRSVSVGNTGADGEPEAFEVDQDEHAMAEQEYEIGEDGRRKRLYTSEEVHLLGQLKDQGKSWQEILESFKPFNRTLSSLQFKWSSRPRVRTMLEAPEALQQREMPASTEEILEAGYHQSGNRARRNRYTSDEIELLFRLKREKKTWSQIEERFKDTTHTICSLQSKYWTLKSDINDTVGQVSENLHEPPPDEPSTGEHVNIIAEPCGGSVTSAAMREEINPGAAFEAQEGPVKASFPAPAAPDLDLSSSEPSLATTLSSRLTMAFTEVMDSPCYRHFKAMMDNHEDELLEGHLYRVVGWGTEKLERENVQSAERLEAIADALWVSIVSHASLSLKDKWVVIEALDEAFTYYVVSHGGFGLVDVKKKVLTHKFGRTRKACTAGAHETNEIVRQMLDANPRPEKRGHVEEAIKVARIYIGHAQTFVEVEMRAYDLFEAITYGCRHNSKVKQSAVSSLSIALERCLDAAQNLTLSQDDVTTQMTEATNNDAEMLTVGTSQGGVKKDDEAVELPVKIPTPSVIDEDRGGVLDSADDGSSRHATMSLGPASSAAIESLDAASMQHTASRPLIRAEPPALTSAEPPVMTLQSEEVPAKDTPLLRADEVKQIVDAILQHPLSEARTFAFKFVMKVLEGRDANTMAKTQAIGQLLKKGLKEYSGIDDINSPGYLGLREAVREHIQRIQHIQRNAALKEGFLDHKAAENYPTMSNVSGEPLPDPERRSAMLAAPPLPSEPSSSSTTNIQSAPEAIQSSARERPNTDAHCTAADMLVANPDPPSRAANLAQVDIAVKFLKARGPDSMAALEDTAFELFKCIDVARKVSYPREAKYCAEDSVQQAMAIYARQNHFEWPRVPANGQSFETRRALASQASKNTLRENSQPVRVLPAEPRGDGVRLNVLMPQDGSAITNGAAPSGSSKTLMRRRLPAKNTEPANKHVPEVSTSAAFIPEGNASEVAPRTRSMESMEDGSACLNATPRVKPRSRLFSERRSDKVQANLADNAGSLRPSPPQSHTLAQDADSSEARTSDIQAPSNATNKAETQPVASVQWSLPARPPVAWKGSTFAIPESTKDFLPRSVSDQPQQPLSATPGPEQPSPIVDERANSGSSTPLLVKSGTMADSSNTATVYDQDRCGAIETLEKAFVWSLNELEDIGEFNGQNLEQTAKTLALSLEQAIHNSSIGEHVYLRQVRTYFNAMGGYAGWTKRLLDDPQYVETLVQMAAEKLSKETRLRRTQFSRMTEEPVAKRQAAVEVTDQMLVKFRDSPLLLNSRQDQRPIPSQCSPAHSQPGDSEGSSARSFRPATGSASSGQDSLTQGLPTLHGRPNSHKRASSTILNTPSSKRVVMAVGPERYIDFAFKERPEARDKDPSEWMLAGGIFTNPTKPKRKRATQGLSHATPRTDPRATNQPPPSMLTLSEEATADELVGTEGAVLAETSKAVPTAHSAQISGSTSQPQHESSKRSRRSRPSTRGKPSAAQPHNSGPEQRASDPPAATPQQEVQTPTTCLTDEAPPAVLAAGRYHSDYVPQLPEAPPAVLRPGRYHNHYIRPTIPSQPLPFPTPAQAPAPSYYNHHAVQRNSEAVEGLGFISIKQHNHDLSPLPDLPAEEIPTAYDDIYEEFPPGLKIEAPSRQPSPALSLNPCARRT